MTTIINSGDSQNFLETTFQEICSEVCSEDVQVVTCSLFTVLGAALLAWGIVHFIPQWGQALGRIKSVSFMTPSQILNNPYAMTALIAGGAFALMGLSKLVTQIFQKIIPPSEATDRHRLHKQVAAIMSGITVCAVAAILIGAAAHAYQHITNGTLTAYPTGAIMITTSQQQLIALLICGSIGGALAGTGTFILGYSLKSLASNEHRPKVSPFELHNTF